MQLNSNEWLCELFTLWSMKNAAYYELCLCVYNLLRDCEGYVEHLKRMLPQIICSSRSYVFFFTSVRKTISNL